MNKLIRGKGLLLLSIIVVLIVYAWFCVFLVKSCSNAIDEIQKVGLKSIVEKIWDGEKEEEK